MGSGNRDNGQNGEIKRGIRKITGLPSAGRTIEHVQTTKDTDIIKYLQLKRSACSQYSPMHI